MKNKRATSHFATSMTAFKRYDMCSLPDDREGIIMARGWLDADGAFYEMPEGQIVKVQDISHTDDILYLYIHQSHIEVTVQLEMR